MIYFKFYDLCLITCYVFFGRCGATNVRCSPSVCYYFIVTVHHYLNISYLSRCPQDKMDSTRLYWEIVPLSPGPLRFSIRYTDRSCSQQDRLLYFHDSVLRLKTNPTNSLSLLWLWCLFLETPGPPVRKCFSPYVEI